MAEVTIDIFTPSGIKVGKFVNPQIQMAPDHYYTISGRFTDSEGTVPDKIEYNPEVLPYIADISSASQCAHKKLVRLYVQRGRQPVEMSGECQKDPSSRL